MKSSYSHKQMGGRHQPDETANPLGLIPFGQILLTGVIYVSQNSLEARGRRVYCKHIHGKNKWRGTAQPLALLFSSLTLLHLARLPTTLTSDRGEGEPGQLYGVWRQFAEGTVKP